MVGQRGTGAGGCGGIRLLSGPSHGEGLAVRAVPLAAVIPSRVPGPVARGRMGRVRVRGAVRRGQSRGRPRRRVTAAGQTLKATSRLAAGQVELLIGQLAGARAYWPEIRAGSGSARHAGRSRPG
jgi:hypothetical protein